MNKLILLILIILVIPLTYATIFKNTCWDLTNGRACINGTTGTNTLTGVNISCTQIGGASYDVCVGSGASSANLGNLDIVNQTIYYSFTDRWNIGNASSYYYSISSRYSDANATASQSVLIGNTSNITCYFTNKWYCSYNGTVGGSSSTVLGNLDIVNQTMYYDYNNRWNVNNASNFYYSINSRYSDANATAVISTLVGNTSNISCYYTDKWYCYYNGTAGSSTTYSFMNSSNITGYFDGMSWHYYLNGTWLSSESDPQVNTLAYGDWCWTPDGNVVNCDRVVTLTAGKWCRSTDGNNIVCDQDTPSSPNLGNLDIINQTRYYAFTDRWTILNETNFYYGITSRYSDNNFTNAHTLASHTSLGLNTTNDLKTWINSYYTNASNISSSYVPYNGAIYDVGLSTHNLEAFILKATGEVNVTGGTIQIKNLSISYNNNNYSIFDYKNFFSRDSVNDKIRISSTNGVYLGDASEPVYISGNYQLPSTVAGNNQVIRTNGFGDTYWGTISANCPAGQVVQNITGLSSVQCISPTGVSNYWTTDSSQTGLTGSKQGDFSINTTSNNNYFGGINVTNLTIYTTSSSTSGLYFSYAGSAYGDAIDIQNRQALAAGHNYMGIYQQDDGTSSVYMTSEISPIGELGLNIHPNNSIVLAVDSAGWQQIHVGIGTEPNANDALTANGNVTVKGNLTLADSSGNLMGIWNNGSGICTGRC